MNTRRLLIVTTVVELTAGASLLLAPSFSAELMLGTKLALPVAVIVGRVAGIAVSTIAAICWLEKEGNDTRTGLVTGLLAYNVSIPVLLSYAAFVKGLSGIAFWPAVGLHMVLAICCITSLRSNLHQGRISDSENGRTRDGEIAV